MSISPGPCGRVNGECSLQCYWGVDVAANHDMSYGCIEEAADKATAAAAVDQPQESEEDAADKDDDDDDDDDKSRSSAHSSPMSASQDSGIKSVVIAYTILNTVLHFYPRDTVPARYNATTRCLSVCLSVCHKSEFYQYGYTYNYSNSPYDSLRYLVF